MEHLLEGRTDRLLTRVSSSHFGDVVPVTGGGGRRWSG